MNDRNTKLIWAAGALGLVGGAFAANRIASARSRAHPGHRDRAEREMLPKASVLDSLATFMDVFLPNIAKGVIMRRPKVVAMSEHMDLDRRAIRRLQKLRKRYGSGPIMLRIPVRNQAVLVEPAHVQRVLAGSPEPFATASSEKWAALSHFEPKGALISSGTERTVRRRFNEEVLDHERDVHRMVESFMPMVEEEAARIMEAARQHGELSWQEFKEGWFRLVRRVVFGNVAAEDHEFNDMTVELRSAANWAFLRPAKKDLQQRFWARIRHYLDNAAPESLAGLIARTPHSSEAHPDQQIPQWLFAFDPAGMATFRALALLASHPGAAARAQEEIRTNANRQNLGYLRACVLESLRLWPTTPLILRQTTEETRWENGTMPARTGVTILAPFFHRDDQRLPFADRFTPELWQGERSDRDWPLVPFSGGPAICPARNLVLLLSSAMLASLLEGREFRLEPPERMDPRKLQSTLDNYSLRFSFREERRAEAPPVQAQAQPEGQTLH
ncbi:MAG TPA: cytochrome P450 [Noviherbaspirillum sp.]|nr:cytochrome P450 [Noviherbaspirillum sp.]